MEKVRGARFFPPEGGGGNDTDGGRLLDEGDPDFDFDAEDIRGVFFEVGDYDPNVTYFSRVCRSCRPAVLEERLEPGRLGLANCTEADDGDDSGLTRDWPAECDPRDADESGDGAGAAARACREVFHRLLKIVYDYSEQNLISIKVFMKVTLVVIPAAAGMILEGTPSDKARFV